MREKANPKNVISINDMEELPLEGYRFRYNSKTKTIDNQDGVEYVEIPDFVKLDTLGMMLKHNLSKDEIGTMTDFHLMVNQEVYERLVCKNIQPTIAIGDDVFYVDLGKDKLVTKDNTGSKGIAFNELGYNYFPEENAYVFPYNTRTKKVEELNIKAKEIPKDILIVKVPFAGLLHSLKWNSEQRIENPMYGVKRRGLQEHFKAEIIPFSETRFAEIIKKKPKTK